MAKKPKFIELRDWFTFNPKQLVAAQKLAEEFKYYLFYGSSRAGKTFLAIIFIRHRAIKYAGSKHLIARFSFANAKKTIWLQTMLPIFKRDENIGLCKINESEGIVKYNNGSIVMLGGLEPSRIDSVLAAEYGTIFITEANENRFENISLLFSRLNDTAQDKDGNYIPLKFICDLNPTTKNHWTNRLFRLGVDPLTDLPIDNFDEYSVVQFKVEDNELNLAKGYVKSLKSLSPSLRKRFYEGEYGTFEGLVFDLNEELHIVDDFDIPEEWERFGAIDFGYTNPFATIWAAFDKSNETLYFYREYKQARTTVRVHSERIKSDEKDEKISCRVADHDAEDRATLQENGIDTIPADKRKLLSLDKMIDLMYSDENKSTNVKWFRSLTGSINEMYNYRWKEAEMKNKTAKDREVVKEDDHLIDCMLYLIMHVFPEAGEGMYIMKDDEMKARLEYAKQQRELDNLRRRQLSGR